MKTNLILLGLLILSAGCGERDSGADAYGNFEATEITVSSETNGRIQKFAVSEGSVLSKGSEIAVLDSTMFILQENEIDAGIKSVVTRLNSINAQNNVLAQQIENLNVNIQRVEKMLRDDAATRKQYDDLTGQAEVLRRQIEANSTQKASVNAEIEVLKARKATVKEQISRCKVKSPISGTLIEKYSDEGELTVQGKALAKIADLSVMRLKVYVSGGQLGSVVIGKECNVRIDDGARGFRNFTGTVATVSDKAEFTPKIIQTKEERVTLVYAVTIDVKNDGSIKSGMPGEAIFGAISR